MANPTARFGIPANDLERAATFYARVFECAVATLIDGTREFTPPSIDGRYSPAATIHPRVEHSEVALVVNLFCVRPFYPALARVQQFGGAVLINTVDASGIRIAFCRDSEGNRFAIEDVTGPRTAPVRGAQT